MYNPILMSRRNELLQALDATPRDLARTLRNVSPTTRGTRIAPDQWSISDILNHINSVEIQSHTHLQQRREIARLSAIIAGGFFCDESNAWSGFLTKGVYDPRLFIFIFDYAFDLSILD